MQSFPPYFNCCPIKCIFTIDLFILIHILNKYVFYQLAPILCIWPGYKINTSRNTSNNYSVFQLIIFYFLWFIIFHSFFIIFLNALNITDILGTKSGLWDNHYCMTQWCVFARKSILVTKILMRCEWPAMFLAYWLIKVEGVGRWAALLSGISVNIAAALIPPLSRGPQWCAEPL